MIKIESLTKSFGSKIIIDDLSLSMPSSGIVAITGPSGIGKSTLIGIVAGIIPFEKGNVTFDKDEKVSLSFQSPTLLPSLTTLDNVNVVMGRKKATKEKAASLLKELGIEDVNKYPSELSGGMAARVNIARSLAFPADVYLFDEPFAALDEETASKVFETILKETKDKLVVMIIHDKDLARSIATTIIDIKEGPISNKTIEVITK